MGAVGDRFPRVAVLRPLSVPPLESSTVTSQMMTSDGEAVVLFRVIEEPLPSVDL